MDAQRGEQEDQKRDDDNQPHDPAQWFGNHRRPSQLRDEPNDKHYDYGDESQREQPRKQDAAADVYKGCEGENVHGFAGFGATGAGDFSGAGAGEIGGGVTGGAGGVLTLSVEVVTCVAPASGGGDVRVLTNRPDSAPRAAALMEITAVVTAASA